MKVIKFKLDGFKELDKTLSIEKIQEVLISILRTMEKK